MRFAGQYYDQEASLHYNCFRYFDPKAGRYLRFDPIGLNGGINAYIYGLNSPIVRIDSYGLDTWLGMSVEADVAFIIFGGISRVIGWFTNDTTGEKCYYETECKKLGIGIMLADVSGNGNAVFNGSKCGRNLSGISVGMTLDVGPVSGSISTDSNGVVSIAAGGGVGPLPGSGNIGAMICKTKITSCENTPCECRNN